MAEVGLLPIARIALQVAKAVLPRYRRRFSKHPFNLPHLWRRLYRRRALIESLFSSVTRKLSARVPGRSLRTQKRPTLLLGLHFNLHRLRHRYLFSRMSTEPDNF
jgi:hypothetical protein